VGLNKLKEEHSPKNCWHS